MWRRDLLQGVVLTRNSYAPNSLLVARSMVMLLSIIFLGFFLGMRHATDPDHVIAIGTIVSRQRTVRSAVVIGSVWGIGHTFPIVLVGGAIIVFSIVIPPRLGLSMEMAVAVMLVLLGLWNLAGIAQRIRDTLISGGPRAPGLHAHVHSHGDYFHSHPHGHGPRDHGHREEGTPQAWLDRRVARLRVCPGVRPPVGGVVPRLARTAGVGPLSCTSGPEPRGG